MREQPAWRAVAWEEAEQEKDEIPIEFHKRRQLFLRTQNVTLPVATIRVDNPDCSPARHKESEQTWLEATARRASVLAFSIPFGSQALTV
jgi:hypothetical protein